MNHIQFVVALPLLLGGCAATSLGDLATYENAADPAVGTSPIGYTTPVAGYSHRLPVDPNPWRFQNDAQSPQGDGA
ncbi:hypothetical protein [Sinorhizobium sp. RAC02]|uniref:hypothetical protein n=1 Tax=Sinorhizobium sp. RAC02 TaxID=1842534 RepID=UPI000857EFB9|nr:hypothetical protein [Sinorhizobium sp. RAC02]AOF93303.1 hypothetical protein BSY16_6055 [Sinorhizobium sp. RAC02]